MDRYVIQRRLGVGGMGVVYLAFDPELNRNVALKLFNGAPRSLSSSSSNEHLMLEARAMAQLQHPNVVAIYDVGQFEATVFLSMQYVEGRTLRRWAKEKPRTWREWRDVMQEEGKGLAAAHHKGLVHRDFKPDNVLVDQNGHVLVTDFGLARRTEERDPTLEGAGTLGYMAPKQVSGESVDARADIFSFCVTFYEGLFNQKPFEGKTARAYLEQVRNGSMHPRLRPKRRLRGSSTPSGAVCAPTHTNDIPPWPSCSRSRRVSSPSPTAVPWSSSERKWERTPLLPPMRG